MPGPRRTTEKRRWKAKVIWVTALVVLIAIGWLVYRELSNPVNTIEFSGP